MKHVEKRSGRVNLRVTPGDAQWLEELSAASGLTASALATMVFAAATEAVRQHGVPLPFPLRLKVDK